MKIKIYTITCAVITIVLSVGSTFVPIERELLEMTCYILGAIFFVGFMILDSLDDMNK